jgi:hypothetical protein
MPTALTSAPAPRIDSPTRRVRRLRRRGLAQVQPAGEQHRADAADREARREEALLRPGVIAQPGGRALGRRARHQRERAGLHEPRAVLAPRGRLGVRGRRRARYRRDC